MGGVEDGWEEKVGERRVEWGSVGNLPGEIREWVGETAALLQPKALWICDGSEEEGVRLRDRLLAAGILRRLPRRPNTFLARTHPEDVARAEALTYIVTPHREDVQAQVAPLHRSMETLSTESTSTSPSSSSTTATSAQWLSPEAAMGAVSERFPGAMAGRVMYVVPFSMGPPGGLTSLAGVELTDSPYVVLCMRNITRVGSGCLIPGRPFARCVHSVGVPLPSAGIRGHPKTWECNPGRTIVLHWPLERRVWSFGSGYGGNAVLNKKCVALRLAAWQAREEGWFAAHMAVFSITREADGMTRNFGAAFPSSCGKTNLSLMKPAKPGFRIKCLGDDITWLRWNPKTGRLCATCPENGFFGIATTSNERTNPIVLDMLKKGGIITNVGETAGGDLFWDGLESLYEKEEPTMRVTDWRGRVRTVKANPKTPYAHPNARFAVPLSQCPIRMAELDPASPGLPLDAILFGSRRPTTFPLIYEASHLIYNHTGQVKEDSKCTPWIRGAYIAASLRSAAKDGTLRPEPFAMRPFLSYNFGRLCSDWLRLGTGKRAGLEEGVEVHPPRIYHVNWFREDEWTKDLLWPGFGDNIRVLEWVMKRLDEGEKMVGLESESGEASLLGIVPREGALDIAGLSPPVNWEALMEQTWTELAEEARDVDKFFLQNGGPEFPYHHISFLACRQFSLNLERYRALFGLPELLTSDSTDALETFLTDTRSSSNLSLKDNPKDNP